MQVPRFSPRISLIEMAPRLAPAAAAPAALPCPCPALPCPVCHHRQTDTTMFALIYKMSPNHGPYEAQVELYHKPKGTSP
jgi:hypothetical protein